MRKKGRKRAGLTLLGLPETLTEAQSASETPPVPCGGAPEPSRRPRKALSEEERTRRASERLLRACERSLRGWLRVLELGEWTVKLSVVPCEATGGHVGNIYWDDMSRVAWMQISQCLTPEMVEETILHEVLHLVLAPPSDTCESILEGLMGEDGRGCQALQKTYDRAENLAVQQLTRIILALTKERMK